MLAEPRRRQKWTLNPRGNLWSKDESKLGQKMIEKMGWKSGDGLGSNNQGMTDPIALKANSDARGLGHKPGDDDVWLSHKDNFDELLANLNSAHGSKANSDEDEEQSAEFTTLASNSKKAKKRVHYAKFTKGKDLSSYSKTDLSCILGTEKRKKRKEEKEEPTEDEIVEERPSFKTAKASSENSNEESVEAKQEPEKDTSGLMVIQGGSMNDYFKNKMKALQEKRLKAVASDKVSDTKSAEKAESKDEPLAKDEKKKKRKKDKKAKEDIVDEVKTIETAKVENIEPKKKSKKNKKDKECSTVPSPSESSTEVQPEDKIDDQVKKKQKKSKNKDKVVDEPKELAEDNNETAETPEVPTKKKRKRRDNEVTEAADKSTSAKKSKKKAEKAAALASDQPIFKGASLLSIKGYGSKS